VPVFHYKAADSSGDVVQGEMEAPSHEAVIRNLEAQGHIPIRAEEIAPASHGEPRSVFRFQRHRPGRGNVSDFTIELATLLQAQMPLDKALETLVSISDDRPFRAVLVRILYEVRGGERLSLALASHGRLFSPFYRNVVGAGEASGALGAALSRLAEFTQRSRDMRDVMLSALLYPIVLVSVGLVSIAIILALVIPKISQMFVESGQTLPWFTQIVIATGGIVQNYWWVMVVVAGGLYAFMRQQYAHPQSRLRWDARLLRLPVVGALIARLEAARFTRTLGALLGENIPLLEAVTIAREVVVNQAVGEGMDQVVERVRQGEGLARPLTEVRVFPPLAGHLIQVGEESGNLDAMLLQLAQIYDHDLQSALRRLTAVLEPTLILGLAVVVAGVMLSIVLAILDVNNPAL